jgi:ADP-ribose pyrophosphatase
MYAYLATGLEKSVLQPDFDEFIEVERYPISEINDLIANGLVKDLKTIMMMMYLKKNPR